MADELSTLFTLQRIVYALLTYWFAATVYNFLTTPSPPKSIPWVGYGRSPIASLRNFLAISKGKEWVTAGYEAYSKSNRIFALPATLGMAAEVVMPREQMGWMFDQPDHVLSTSEAHYDFLQGAYAFVDPVILKDPYHEHVVHKNLVRNLNAILPDLEEEVPPAVESIYGTDTETWKKLDVMDTFMSMIPTLTNRMLVGKPVCRERGYLDAVLSFTLDVIRTQSVLFLFPAVLHPLIGPLLGLAAKYHYWRSAKWSLPLCRQRVADIQRKDAGDPALADWTPPSDFITWSYRTAMAEGRAEEAHPTRIAKRIMPLNFASIHTTSLTAYEVMINILTAPPAVVAALREEAARVLEEEGGWTKAGLSRMHRMDSAIRESQRASPIALTFIARKVVAKEGITTPEGVHVKYGTLLSCPWAPIALDDEVHEGQKAGEFDAFRYSRGREEWEAMGPEERQEKERELLRIKQSGLVTTSHRHLPFGHGRHACPGRFFVSHELKMIFAHLLLNYDFKPLAEKPKKLWIVRFQVPMPAQIEVRRRKSMWRMEKGVNGVAA